VSEEGLEGGVEIRHKVLFKSLIEINLYVEKSKREIEEHMVKFGFS
jgi:hypothetical protein